MCKRDECISVRVYQERQRFSQTSHVYIIAEGALAADVKRGGKTAGKREITLNFYLQASQVAQANLAQFWG